MHNNIVARLACLPVAKRFIPYIQSHEFEALLFADPNAFLETFPNRTQSVERLSAIRDRFANPEDIGDKPLTVPSKRILPIFPEDQKPFVGTLLAHRIGLDAIRAVFRRCNTRIARLHALTPVA